MKPSRCYGGISLRGRDKDMKKKKTNAGRTGGLWISETNAEEEMVTIALIDSDKTPSRKRVRKRTGKKESRNT